MVISMRNNGPVTGHEVFLTDELALVSRTDIKGKITFVNKAFTEVSGFSEAELLGSPHNLVRHPDMPKEAFANLWATIRAGRPWEGLVKNRCRNGDHYWVKANVTPIIENGQVTEFVSIRSKPSREDIVEAERVYAAIRGGSTDYALHDGGIVRRGAGQKIRELTSSIAGRLAASYAVMLLSMLLSGVQVLSALGSITASSPVVIGLLLFNVLVVVGSFFGVLKTIYRPIRLVEAHLDAISSGDLMKVIPSSGIAEFSRIRSQLRAVKAKLGYVSQERAERQRQADEQRITALLDMAATVEREAGNAVERVARRSGDIAGKADGMAGAAERVSANAQSVAVASEQSLSNAQTVAAAAEQLAVSIGDISSQISHSSQVTRQAVNTGRRAEEAIQSLSQAVMQIGKVVSQINDIAHQTNLLALNATIEASRAGQAGKGFAVVAHEVKSLSSQTGSFTAEITRQISSIQEATGSAVAAVEEMSETIGGIDRISGSIAAAMEQQTAATREISRRVVESSNAAREVSSRISMVSEDAKTTRAHACEIHQESGDVVDGITALRQVLTHVVRTSTKDADRRRQPRFRVNEPGLVTVGGQALQCTVENVSAGGALITGPALSEIGERGILRLERHGVETEFEVTDRGSKALHVKFRETAAGMTAFQSTLDRITARLTPVSEVA